MILCAAEVDNYVAQNHLLCHADRAEFDIFSPDRTPSTQRQTDIRKIAKLASEAQEAGLKKSDQNCKKRPSGMGKEHIPAWPTSFRMGFETTIRHTYASPERLFIHLRKYIISSTRR